MCKECEKYFKMDDRNDPHYQMFKCHDCGKNTNNNVDYYMVEHEIWNEFGVGEGMLCIACLEERVGRKLKGIDFLPCPLNMFFNPYVRHELLNL